MPLILFLTQMFLQKPHGYNLVLRMNGGDAPDYHTDPQDYAKIATVWALQSPMKTLSFFESELASSDPAHVKAGLRGIEMLTIMMECVNIGQASKPPRKSSRALFLPISLTRSSLRIQITRSGFQA